MFAFISHSTDDSEQLPNKAKHEHLWSLLIAGAVAVAILVLLALQLHPSCLPLLTRSEEAVISLPENCAVTPNVASDEMVKYLEKERIGRGLVFKQWITCQDLPRRGLAFLNDSHWLPSYVPSTYQLRRTVIIVPYAHPIPHGSPVVAEVCLMPWRRYIRQIAGQCNGKFSVWK